MEKKSKKGAVEVQFHWIFVILVGGIILLFFVSIINSQKEAGKEKISQQLTIDIDKIISTAMTQKETLYELDFPKRKIYFTCNDLVVGNIPKSIGNNIIFSPDFLESEKLLIWIKEINAPFPVDNAVYMCTPESKFFIHEDGTKLSKIYNSLPEKLRERKIFEVFEEDNDINTFISSDTVRFVVSNSEILVNNNIKSLAGKIGSASALVLDESGMTFYKWDKTIFTAQTTFEGKFSDELILAAIYENDPDVFGCMNEKIIGRYLQVSEVYMKKSEILREHYTRSSVDTSSTTINYDTCAVYYLAAFNNIKNARDGFEKGKILRPQATAQLVNINRNLQIESCVPLY